MSAQADFNCSKFYRLIDYVESLPKAEADPIIGVALTQLRLAELAIFGRLDELADEDY